MKYKSKKRVNYNNVNKDTVKYIMYTWAEIPGFSSFGEYEGNNNDIGIKNGAYGGKILGAGGAGFIMFVIPKEKQATLRQKLPNCAELSFKFEDEGSTITSN